MKSIYAIRDRIAKDLVTMQMYSLMVFHNDATATRYFADCILDPKSVLAIHPDDYELIKVGYLTTEGKLQPTEAYYDDNGKLLSFNFNPEIIITGSALIAAQQKPQLVKEA